MNDLELGHRLRTALDEYTEGVPLPNVEGPTFRSLADEFPPSLRTSGYLRTDRRYHSKPRRLFVVLAVIVGLMGTGTGLAAASGAFDHQAAVRSFDQSVRLMMRGIQHGFNEQFAGEYRSVLKTFKPKDIVFETAAHGPDHSIFTVWTYANHSGAPWCQGLVVTAHKRANALGFGCQLSGSSPVPGLASQESEWPCAPPSSPEYFVISGEVPANVARVVLQIPDLGPLDTEATNGWFVTVASTKITSPVPETFFNASGAQTGSGMWNGGASTC
jgi:hypothetical protein